MDPGQTISVAVVDGGIDTTLPDVGGQVLAVNVNRSATSLADGYGHGTHVAAIINSHDPDGQYYGLAPSTTMTASRSPTTRARRTTTR